MLDVVGGPSARSEGATPIGGALPFDDGFLDEIRNIGVFYFILVRIGPDAGSQQYVCCKTQNDAGTFVNQLAALPGFGQSMLLRGIERALQQEIYDAADLMFSWTRAAGGVAEAVHVGEPDGVLVHALYNYPVFAFDCATGPTGPEHRTSVLRDMLETYVATDGNDALRFSIIEATALALSRAFGAQAKYSEALAAVEKGLSVKPYSIHLKAAKQTLLLKLEGQQIPLRLLKFIGEDDGYLKQFVCPIPFERFDIGPNGDVLVCCGHWLPTTIGNFLKEPVEQVLNSPTARRIRQSVTDGSYKYCNHLECTPMIQGALPTRDRLISPQTRAAAASADYRVDGVEQLMFALDQTCNLSCPSCRTHRIVEKASEATEKAQAVEDKLLPLLSTVGVLHINPAGELLASKPSRKILELIDDERCPDLRIDIISNGTLFNEEEWNKFPGIHNKVRSIRISIDAARKETFEKLRRLGKYETFVENMRFLGRLRATGVIPQLKFSFTYQLDNFREMRQFIAFGDEMNADFVIFERLQNIAFTPDEFRSKAVHYPDHPLYAEFLHMVRDPIFRDTRVWHDFDYDGVDKLTSQEAWERLHGIPPTLAQPQRLPEAVITGDA